MLADLIKTECGLVDFKPESLAYMVTCVQLAFRTKDCVFVYFNKENIAQFYFMPINEVNKTKPRLSKPLTTEEWNCAKEEAFAYIKECVHHSKLLKELHENPKIEIIIKRTLPKLVKNAQNEME